MEDHFFKNFKQKTQKKAREDRLAKALRENLRKRKSQQRARVEENLLCSQAEDIVSESVKEGETSLQEEEGLADFNGLLLDKEGR